uniref:DUF659 domain-containing protein n=1 Tax=Amphimedon queenslandica TaxID=400682 RepID=A0A1X7T3R7_AMPQE
MIQMGGRKYSCQSDKYCSITQKLAVFIGWTNALISFGEDDRFKLFTQTLDSCYELPSRSKIIKEITNICNKLKKEILTYLHSAQYVNICPEIWTKKGMSALFLELIAHFFSTKDKKRRNVTLAAHFTTHCSENMASLVDAVLEVWNIPETMVNRILTDNGSNMLGAFRQQHKNNDEEVERICDDMDENESDVDDQGSR